MRYTKKFIEARFAMAMKAIGAKTGPSWDSGKAIVGTYSIDHMTGLGRGCGGYTIVRIDNEGGAESQPFGSSRYNANEFVALLTGILNTAHIMKTKGN